MPFEVPVAQISRPGLRPRRCADGRPSLDGWSPGNPNRKLELHLIGRRRREATVTGASLRQRSFLFLHHREPQRL